MIAEDYVSFETAKLLKEKGFPQEYDIYHSMVYNEEDYEDEYEIQRMVIETRTVKAGTLSSYPLGVPEPRCYCPTLQMAMKWLRDIHNLDIIVPPQFNNSKWTYSSIIFKLSIPCTEIRLNDNKDEKEEACEEAIKYCLENLI